mmetsp:Transcript_17262/g.37677  ORF Transcript_17262/g.37677 Transcript_17262/m.37677 type:complete len:262 (+) Transcript_17262:164-949(+)|eukprot:CAMPEP_0168735332 /NCGR_PEP_ID=MMETSP0724-20121128/9278_1 /TAXON_ID=265536 /ORGANISM="Amphiprora sp., Strain CCMP467" /LENGTH=261 /DNA_ID=CAMNT_0008782471 /DNA_START=111 /DNA_END=896 /DNA_ORIENTATION=+
MLRHSAPVPTEVDYDHVHKAPAVLTDPRTTVAEEPGLVTKLTLREHLWSSWKKESFTICHTETKRPYALHVQGRLYNFKDRMLLRDAEGNPCAVLLKTKQKHEETLQILGLRPYVKNQEGSAHHIYDNGRIEKSSSFRSQEKSASFSSSLSSEKSDSEKQQQQQVRQDLYLWGQVVDNELDSLAFALKMRDGSKYVAEPVGHVLAPRQYRITRNGKVCGHVAQTQFFAELRGHCWNICIGPGIDPGIMIAFVIIMDEMTEY